MSQKLVSSKNGMLVVLFCFIIGGFTAVANGEYRILELPVTESEGDWSATSIELYDTSEAEYIIRVGDIDNMNVGWRIAYNPFKGGVSRKLPLSWDIVPDDPAGTDRVMVIQGARQGDMFTKENQPGKDLVESFSLNFFPIGEIIVDVYLQIFLSGIEQRMSKTGFIFSINGEELKEVSEMFRALSIKDLRGELLTFKLPSYMHDMLKSGVLEIKIDAEPPLRSNGFAVDFAKLLINKKAFKFAGSVVGSVNNLKTLEPMENIKVSSQGIVAYTNDQGEFRLDGIAAGNAVIKVETTNLPPTYHSVKLQSGEVKTRHIVINL